MIKKFNEFINESLWGNSIKRSRGEEIRKEDDVDNFSLGELTDYIREHYELDNYLTIKYKVLSKNCQTIGIFVSKDSSLFMDVVCTNSRINLIKIGPIEYICKNYPKLKDILLQNNFEYKEFCENRCFIKDNR